MPTQLNVSVRPATSKGLRVIDSSSRRKSVWYCFQPLEANLGAAAAASPSAPPAASSAPAAAAPPSVAPRPAVGRSPAPSSPERPDSAR